MCKQRRITVAEKGLSKRTGRSVNSGFTLVELLVVIAIIALLMSILMPALRRVKMQAQEVSCRSNIKQVGLIIYLYLQENEFQMPHFWEYDYSGTLGSNYSHSDTKANGYFWRNPGTLAGPIIAPDSGPKTYWGTNFRDYVKETKVFGCPAFKNALEMAEIDKLYGADVKEFYDTAFGMNGYMDWINVNGIKSQGDVIVTSDHIEPRIEQADDTSTGHNDMFCPGVTGEPLSHYQPGGSRYSWYRGILRHNVRLKDPDRTGGRANVLYLDNHVDTLEEKDIFDLKVPNRSYDPLWKELTPP